MENRGRLMISRKLGAEGQGAGTSWISCFSTASRRRKRASVSSRRRAGIRLRRRRRGPRSKPSDPWAGRSTASAGRTRSIPRSPDRDRDWLGRQPEERGRLSKLLPVEERHLSALAPLGTLSTLSVHRKFRVDPSQPGLRTLAAAVGRALLECADVVREIRDFRPVQR